MNTILAITDSASHLLTAILALNSVVGLLFKLYVDSKNEIIKTLKEINTNRELEIKKLREEHKSEQARIEIELKESKTHEQLVIEKLMIAFDKSNMTLEEVLKLYKNE